MPISNMSIKMADEIRVMIADILTEQSIQHIPISRLKGYSILDICNALCLCIADSYFNSKGSNKEECKKLSLVCESSLCNIDMMTVPDNIFQQLNKFEPFSMEYMMLDIKLQASQNALTQSGKNTLHYKKVGAFADYCIGIGWNNPEYWNNIYKELKIRNPQMTNNSSVNIINDNKINNTKKFKFSQIWIIKKLLERIDKFATDGW